MSRLQELIAKEEARRDLMAQYLDQCSHEERLMEIRSLSGKEQAALYERVAGATPIGLDYYVPPSVPPMTEVIHHGKNSLPMFTDFQKRFCRPAGKEHGEVLWGYNEQTMRFVTGPGYFVVRPVPEEKRVVIDYTRVPSAHPDEWPEIQPNSRLFSRLVYYQMQDFMWKVSEHVSIGRACKNGKWMPNYFVLCREDR